MAFVLAGSLSNVAQAHSDCHSRRAKSIHMAAYTARRTQASNTADNTASTDNTAITVQEVPEAAPVQAQDTAPAYAACYENGYCTGNNLCDVNGVCQNGGICNGVPCTNAPCNDNYGHHGGGHHGGRYHH